MTYVTLKKRISKTRLRMTGTLQTITLRLQTRFVCFQVFFLNSRTVRKVKHYINCVLSQSFLCQSGHFPLNHRLIYVDSNFRCSTFVQANIDNPASDCIFHLQYENLYDKNKKCIKSIGFRIQKHIDDLYIPLDIDKPVNCKPF